jgi:hypothetical protein
LSAKTLHYYRNILWKICIDGISKLNHIIIKVSLYCPFWYLLLAGSQLISNRLDKAQQNKREKLVKWNKCRTNDAACTRINACYYINMEWNIYLLSGIRTNECKKYWVLQHHYMHTNDDLFLLHSFWLWFWLWFLHEL